MRIVSSTLIKYVLLMFLACATNVKAKSESRHDKHNSAANGETIFYDNCRLCHGANADGNGKAAINYDPPPANLLISTLSDAQKKKIIKSGGKSVGRSEFMPAWGYDLSETEINDIIHYLKRINVNDVTDQTH